MKQRIGYLLALIVMLGAGIGLGVFGMKMWSNTPEVSAQAGAQEREVTVERVEKSTEPGILVTSVVADSPAAVAGLLRGDVILAIDGETVNDVAELRTQLGAKQSGDVVTLAILRGGEPQQFQATLSGEDGLMLGIVSCGPGHAGNITFDRGSNFTLPDMKGNRVIDVQPDSAAATAGLQPGDVITAVDDKLIDIDHDLVALLTDYAPGDTISLSVTRGEEMLTLTATLDEHPENAGKSYLGIQYVPSFDMQFDVEKILPNGSMPFFHGDPFGKGQFTLPENGFKSGAVIKSITPDSPAAAAGLTAEEVITAINGEPVTGPQQLVKTVQGLKPGDTITLTLANKDGESREVSIPLGENGSGAAFLGVQIGPFFQIETNRQESVPFGSEDGHGFNFSPGGMNGTFHFFQPPVQWSQPEAGLKA